MNIPTPERAGVLVLRLWVEGDPITGLRARITQISDSSASTQVTATAASPEGIYAAVRSWVEGFLDSERSDIS